MSDYRLAFDAPWCLLLLLLLPALWWYSLRRLSGFGRVRKAVVIGLRSLVLALLVLALAEVQMVRISDRLTVIYLLDQSMSIPAERRSAMIAYVNEAIRQQREGRNRVGVVVFGRDAAIEIPPFDDDVRMDETLTVALDQSHTDLAGALKLAQASFPEDAAKRIVLVSDGNENLGNVLEQAQGAAGSGIGIDVMPVRFDVRSEVIVDRVAIPADVRRGEPFDLKIVLTNTAQPRDDDKGHVRGRLKLWQRSGGQSVLLSDEQVSLPPGKRVFTVRQEIDSPNFYTYEAEFLPDDPAQDPISQNNRATAFTHIRGKGQVLLIEDYRQRPAEGEPPPSYLADQLRKQELEVTRQWSDQLFTGLDQLQPYDTVVLDNVARVTDEQVHFTDEQVAMLVRNTQQMGAGLVMIGGPDSFGAGGWTGSELEKAMPVDFQIKAAKVVPRGALCMLLHACEIPEGNHWQKVIAHKAIEVLGDQDFCGVIQWIGTDQWLWQGGLVQVEGNRRKMLALVDRMTPSDMPQFDPSMRMAAAAFQNLGPKVSVKHMIIISDGDPSPPSNAVLANLKQMNVTVSTVAVGAHGPAESRLLAQIAASTGGKYYAVRNANALPRIFQREARRVARSLLYEKTVRPRVKFPHEMISGLPDPLPPVKGFVMTSVKDNPLVEVSLVSPEPPGEENSTILASWTYGLGKAVVFTSDSGARWTAGWAGTETYNKLFGNIVRWSMRPSGDTAKFNVAADVEGEQVRFVVNALDKDDEFLNQLEMAGTAVGPNMEPVPIRIEQTAPGRYVGTLPAGKSGSYFVNITSIHPGAPGGKPQITSIRTGVNVPYSDEFRGRATNEPLLGELARLAPKGGKPGLVIEAPSIEEIEAKKPLAANPFRPGELPKASTSQDAWFYVVLLAGCLFFCDVFFRRVQVSFAWVGPAAGRVRDFVLRREPKPAESEYIGRLRSRKAEVTDHIEQLRGAVRFEIPETAEPVDLAVLDESKTPQTPADRPAGPAMTDEPREESYTERLLKAKKKAWEDQNRPK
jgi:uncharacterized membrane protein